MVIVGTLAEWREWTGLLFERSGIAIVPGALSPVHVSLEQDHAVYVEPICGSAIRSSKFAKGIRGENKPPPVPCWRTRPRPARYASPRDNPVCPALAMRRAKDLHVTRRYQAHLMTHAAG